MGKRGPGTSLDSPPSVGSAPTYLAFGDLSVDSVARLEHFPTGGEKLWVRPEGDFPGGMMGNAAATVVALGLSAGVVALLGDDSHGDLVMEDLRRRGVDTRFVRRIHAATFWTLALTTPEGERALIQFPTPAFPADWEGFDRSSIARSRWVHTAAEQGEPVLELFATARSHGVRTSLDIEHPFELRDDLLEMARLTDVAFLNRASAETLGGAEAAARSVRAMGAGVVTVTLGDEGCLLLVDEECQKIAALPVDAVDTNGAGDAFAGAFAVAQLRGWTPLQSAQFANLVAGLSTTGLGGHGGDLREEVVRHRAQEAGYEWWSELP